MTHLLEVSNQSTQFRIEDGVLRAVDDVSFTRAAGETLGIVGESGSGKSVTSLSIMRLVPSPGGEITGGRIVFDDRDLLTVSDKEMRDLRDGPPQGQLKISAPCGFGRKVVAPLLVEFRRQFPEVVLELQLQERMVDLAAERIDVAFRDGRLEDSQIIARQLMPMRLMVCASPDYARRHGLPRTLDELAAHACVNQRLDNGRLQTWDFKIDGRAHGVVPASTIVVNDPALAMQAVLDGQGIAQLAAYQASEALRAGLLVSCLDDIAPDDRGHHLCYLSRHQLPKRVRVFIDFMTARIRALDLEGTTAVTPAAVAA